MQWTHGISSRKTDLVNGEVKKRGKRVSLTFRSVLGEDGDVMEYVEGEGEGVGGEGVGGRRPGVEGVGVVEVRAASIDSATSVASRYKVGVEASRVVVIRRKANPHYLSSTIMWRHSGRTQGR